MTRILALSLIIVSGLGLWMILHQQPPEDSFPPTPHREASAVHRQSPESDAALAAVAAQIASEPYVGNRRLRSYALRLSTEGPIDATAISLIAVSRRIEAAQSLEVRMETLAHSSGAEGETLFQADDQLIGVLVMAPGHEGCWIDVQELANDYAFELKLALTPWRLLLHHDYAPLATGRGTTSVRIGQEPGIVVELFAATKEGLIPLATVSDTARRKFRVRGLDIEAEWTFEAQGFVSRTVSDPTDFHSISQSVRELGLLSENRLARSRVELTIDASRLPGDPLVPIEILVISGSADEGGQHRFTINPGTTQRHAITTASYPRLYAAVLTKGYRLQPIARPRDNRYPPSDVLFLANDGRLTLDVVPAIGNIPILINRPAGFGGAKLRVSAFFYALPELDSIATRWIEVPAGDGPFSVAVEDWSFSRAHIQLTAVKIKTSECPHALDLEQIRSSLGIRKPQLDGSIDDFLAKKAALPQVFIDGSILISVAPGIENSSPIAFWWAAMARIEVKVITGDLSESTGRIDVINPEVFATFGEAPIPVATFTQEGDGLYFGCLAKGSYTLRASLFEGFANAEMPIEVTDGSPLTMTMTLTPERSAQFHLRLSSGESLQGLEVSLHKLAGFSQVLMAEGVLGADQTVTLRGIESGLARLSLKDSRSPIGFARPGATADLVQFVDFAIDERARYEFTLAQGELLNLSFESDLGEIPRAGMVTLEHVESGERMTRLVMDGGRLSTTIASKPGVFRILQASLSVPAGAQRPAAGAAVVILGDGLVRTGQERTKVMFTRSPR